MNEIYNKLRTWGLKSNPMAVSMLLYLISHAARVDVYVGGKNVCRGQIRTSIGNLQKALGMTRQQVRTTIRLLGLNGEITQQSTQSGTIITICNYDLFSEKINCCNTGYNTQKCASRVHELVDKMLSRDEFTEKKGMLVMRIPINCGGLRSPQVVFENDVGVEVRLGEDVVWKERII